MENIKDVKKEKKALFNLGVREKTIFSIGLFVSFFVIILIWGSFIDAENLYVDLLNKLVKLILVPKGIRVSNEVNGMVMIESSSNKIKASLPV